MKDEQVPMARVRGPLPPLGPTKGDEAPNGFVLPLYSLYSPGQVALATFLGTPLAGSWLVARNFKKLGSPRAAWGILALGVLWALGLCGLAALDKLPGIVSLASIPAMVLVMRGVQGQELDRHTSLGGKTTSWGWAVLAGIASLAILFVAAIGIAIGYYLMTRAPGVDAPRGGEVLYTDGATEQDAIKLKDALAELHYWNGPYTVQVGRNGERYVVSYVVTDEAFRDRKVGQQFGDMAELISHQAFADQPVDTVLLDEYSEPHATYRFEDRLRTRRMGTGKDDGEVRYRDIDSTMALMIGQVLRSKGYFADPGGVALVEHRTGTLSIELWSGKFEPTPMQDLIGWDWVYALAHQLDAQVDLKFGNLEDEIYASYLWAKREPGPVVTDEGITVFYRYGATLAEAERVAKVLAEHDEAGHAAWSILMHDDNYEPARPVLAVHGDDESTELLHRLAEPLSKQAFGNAPVDLRVIDNQLAAKVVLSWEKRPKSKSGAIRPTR